jgi:hypothetical protein
LLKEFDFEWDTTISIPWGELIEMFDGILTPEALIAVIGMIISIVFGSEFMNAGYVLNAVLNDGNRCHFAVEDNDRMFFHAKLDTFLKSMESFKTALITGQGKSSRLRSIESIFVKYFDHKKITDVELGGVIQSIQENQMISVGRNIDDPDFQVTERALTCLHNLYKDVYTETVKGCVVIANGDHLELICSSPNFLRQGVATDMINERLLNTEFPKLSCDKKNKVGLNFYKKHGFVEGEDDKKHKGFVVMTK